MARKPKSMQEQLAARKSQGAMHSSESGKDNETSLNDFYISSKPIAITVIVVISLIVSAASWFLIGKPIVTLSIIAAAVIAIVLVAIFMIGSQPHSDYSDENYYCLTSQSSDADIRHAIDKELEHYDAIDKAVHKWVSAKHPDRLIRKNVGQYVDGWKVTVGPKYLMVSLTYRGNDVHSFKDGCIDLDDDFFDVIAESIIDEIPPIVICAREAKTRDLICLCIDGDFYFTNGDVR